MHPLSCLTVKRTFTPMSLLHRLTFSGLGIILGLLVVSPTIARGQETAPWPIDPHQVVGHEKCVKCHQPEVEVWKKTPHSQTFETLHRKPEAAEIIKKLGLQSVKRNDVCIQCHYTMQHVDGKDKAVSGVSCESCHGAANAWVDIHSDYGGPKVTRAQESAEHRKKRREVAMEKGMRNPVNLYLVAQSCLACHTTPNEQLVNQGGHSAGSKDFELVAWSQGMVRHNFAHSEGKLNAASPPDRLRVMYVVGQLADLEYSLRATAKATQKAKFGMTSARRADEVRKRLEAIQAQINDPYVQQALDAVAAAKLKLNNEEELLRTAAAVSAAAFAFAETADGSGLAPIDAWLPKPNSYK